MIARFHYDDETLGQLLDDKQTSHGPELASHVESCPQCQDRLEAITQDGLTWEEAGGLLGDASYELAEEPDHSPDAPATSFLQTTDHPDSLGRFGRYEIMELLGRGGMGIVMRGFDPALNRHSAVKVLAPELASSAAARRRFSREAKSAAAVVHPHVVPIHTVDQEAGLPYLVMPVVEGQSLQQRVERDGPLPHIEVVRIASQIADGLAAAHAQGLVHRDIKPANILLENGVERVQITDFGLARAADDASMTRSGVIAGTPQYMSPQQAHGDEIDHRSDLFSLGSVMYFMLTGRSPFRAENTMGVLNRIANDEPRRLCSIHPEIPAWLEQIVRKLLAKSPEDRFESATQVAELLDGCLAHVQQPTTTPLPESVAKLAKSFGPQGNTDSAESLDDFRYPPIGKFIAAAAFAFSLIVAGVVIVLELNKGTLTIESEVDNVPIRIVKGKEIVKQLTVNQSGETIRIGAGQYVVMIDGPTDAITVKDGQVSLSRGDQEIVKIVRSGHPSEAEQALRHNPVEIALGKSTFQENDRIDIQSVTSSGNGFEVGATVTVNGVYTLNSVDSADMCFYSTTTLKPGEKPTGTPIQPSQRMKAQRGTHAFTLSKVIREEGSPHVTFYHSTTGKGIGGVYFSEAKEDVAAKDDAAGAKRMGDMIDHVNEIMKEFYPTIADAPLTRDELIACASWHLERDADLSSGMRKALSAIAHEHRLPMNVSLHGGVQEMLRRDPPVDCYRIILLDKETDEIFFVRERFLAPPKGFPKPDPRDRYPGVPLAAAINRFNARHHTANGQRQSPLTEDEVVAAILFEQTKRDEADVSDALFESFQSIAGTRTLPEGTELDVVPTFSSEGGPTYTIWSVRVKMPQDGKGREGWTYAFEIRKQFVSVKQGSAGEIQWGKPAENGLQAGVRLNPPLLEYKTNQEIEVEIVYRNILSKLLPGSVPNFLVYDDVIVRDSNGASVTVIDSEEPAIIGGWKTAGWNGQRQTLRGRSIVLVTKPLWQESWDEHSHLIVVRPGQSYKLQFAVGNSAARAKGSIKTGEVEFSVMKGDEVKEDQAIDKSVPGAFKDQSMKTLVKIPQFNVQPVPRNFNWDVDAEFSPAEILAEVSRISGEIGAK